MPDDTQPPGQPLIDPVSLDDTGGGSIETYKYATSFGSRPDGDGVFDNPNWIGVDGSSGSVYVVDSNNHRIQKFSSTGVFLLKWNVLNSLLNGIAVDKTGNVYVADGSGAVQKFNRDGVFISRFSTTQGSETGSNPVGIVVDSVGRILVSDSSNSCIKKFDKDGVYLSKFGTYGTANGQFDAPLGIGVDPLGYIYVVDSGNHRVQKFSKAGTYISKWGTYGGGDGQFESPTGLAIDSLGYVYVVDGFGNRIEKFTAAGAFIRKWGSYGEGNTQLRWPMGIGADRTGNLYVGDSGNQRVVKFNSSGTYLTKWGPKPDGVVRGGGFLTTDAAGNVFVSDSASVQVQKFSGSGTFLTKWGTIGHDAGQLRYNRGIAVSSGGTVYLGDMEMGRINKYSLTGTYLGVINVSLGSGPNGLAVDASGNLYVVDAYHNRIQKYNSGGTHLLDFGSAGSGNGQFNWAYDVAIDNSGYIYVSDQNNYRIQKFTSGGVYVTQWGGQGSTPGKFDSPGGIGIDNLGNIWVADNGNARIQKFSPAGVFLQEINLVFPNAEYCSFPMDVAFDQNNNMYVADGCGESGPVLKFTSNKWSTQFGYNQGWRVETHPRVLGDVNGDGMQDLVGFSSSGVMVALSSGTSFGTASLWLANYGYNQGWRVETHPRAVADVNGDGKADVVGFGSAGVMVSLSTGASFNAPVLWLANYGYNQGWRVDMHPRTVADVNGDGKADVVGFANGGVMVSLSNGTSFIAPVLWIAEFGYAAGGWRVDMHPRMTADANGDGKADIIGFGYGGVLVALSSGTNFAAPTLWIANYGYTTGGWLVNQHPRMMGDTNGDGKADIFGFGNDWVYISDSNGTTFEGTYSYLNEYGYSSYAGSWRTDRHVRLVGDVNGDGLDDIVGIHNNGVFVSLR